LQKRQSTPERIDINKNAVAKATPSQAYSMGTKKRSQMVKQQRKQTEVCSLSWDVAAALCLFPLGIKYGVQYNTTITAC